MATDEKPSRNEDEYFVRLDAERIKELRAKLDAERQAAERAATAPKCPRDGSALQERTVNHVTIDECPQCGGVWLDKGELQLVQQVPHEDRGNFFGNLFGSKR